MVQTHMHIGAVAERTGLSLRTLRHYDEIGLLTPPSRTEGGFRLYTESDLTRLLLIRRMKPLGFTLEEMGDVLDIVERLRTAAPRSSVDLHIRLQTHLASALERRADLAHKLGMADEFITLLRMTSAPPITRIGYP